MPAMTRIDLPYLWLPIKRGKLTAYYRRTGAKAIRIRGPDRKPLVPGQAGFVDAYQRLHRAAGGDHADGGPKPAPKSLAALVAEYKASDAFQDLSAATRADYTSVFNALVERFGAKSIPAMPRSAVFEVRRQFATDANGKPTPARANKAVRHLRLLLTWAVDHGWRTDNPALRPGRLRTGPGYPAWSAEHLATFMECPAIREPLKRAVITGWYTGLRLSDCIRLPRSARRGGMLEVVPSKTQRSTGAIVRIPVHPELARWLDGAPPSTATTLLTRADGMPWRADGLKHAMTGAVRKAGLPPGLSFHGLRKGLTAALANEGSSDAEIDAVIPHSDGRMTRHYRAQANQEKLAVVAIGRLPRNATNTPTDTHDDKVIHKNR